MFDKLSDYLKYMQLLQSYKNIIGNKIFILVNYDTFSLSYSCSLCAAVDWPSLNRKSSLCFYGDGMFGFLGDRGGIREHPCCLRVDQVCVLIKV